MFCVHHKEFGFESCTAHHVSTVSKTSSVARDQCVVVRKMNIKSHELREFTEDKAFSTCPLQDIGLTTFKFMLQYNVQYKENTTI